MGTSLMAAGGIAEARAHFDQAIALYDPIEHAPLGTRRGLGTLVGILTLRSLALWALGYPEAAVADTEDALKNAREMGRAAVLMFALFHGLITHILCRSYVAANAVLDELIGLADKKSASQWKGLGILMRGEIFALTGKTSNAVALIAPGIAAYRSTGATVWIPLHLSCLARAYAEIGKFDEAWRCIGEATTAMETTKERWWEAEVNCTAGEIALKSPTPDTTKAQACFEHALAVGRKQQAKSWELRAAMSMARLRRDKGKRDEARELLAPVYGWFTEGFDTLDLKEAKALLDELRA